MRGQARGRASEVAVSSVDSTRFHSRIASRRIGGRSSGEDPNLGLMMNSCEQVSCATVANS